jgi:hypothetical protein
MSGAEVVRPSEHRMEHPCIARDGYRVLAAGTSGTGKTTIALRSLLHDVSVDGRFALVYDADGATADALVKGSAWRQRLPRELVAEVRSMDDVRDALKRSGPLGWFRRSPVRVVVVPALRMPTVAAARALWLSIADSKRAHGWALLADEADELFPLSLPQKGPTQRVLRAIRNNRQILYATTNYPQSTAPRLRQLTQHACIFAGENAEFVNACRWFGTAKYFEGALALKNFQYIYRAPRGVPPLPVLHALEDAIPW